MEKSILVIRTPKGCMDCPVCRVSEYSGGYICVERDVEEYITGKYGSKPDWCPLKPLPEKMTIKIPDGLSESSKMTLQSVLTVGWESCMKEILGDTE